MLVIKTIKLGTNYVKQIKRISKVRVGYDNNVCVNKVKPKIFQQQVIQWQQDMTLPVLFKRELEFQFYPEHQFGYNPEQIHKIFYAKKNSQQANVVGPQGRIIGRLYFQYKLINDHTVKQSPQIETKVKVSSILAHFDSYYGEKGHFQMWIENQNSITPYINIIAGQLLWTEKLSLHIFDDSIDEKPLVIKVFVDNVNVGEAKIIIRQLKNNPAKYKKFPIIEKDTNLKCGMIFMDIIIKNVKTNLEGETGRRLTKEQNRSQVYFPSLIKNKNNKSEKSLKVRTSNSEKKLGYPISQTKPILKGERQIKNTKSSAKTIFQQKLGKRSQLKAHPKNNIINLYK